MLSPENEAALLESGWPLGHVRFNNVSMRYNPGSPLVLDRVCVDIPAGTTLGVVGRTGSGKSSLLLTLFRLVDVEGAGSITIDGVDIRSLSLQGLRDSLSIIPQSPTLFAGTLLYNLDSSGRATPESAWSSLEAASTELARQFRDSESGLETMISEGGRNLSLGQRQLICLARALVKRSNILVLDEATSSVDTKTDSQVQETIFREFVQKGVTVITVAHRLDTVLGYDKILVLDAGKMVEFGTPSELLSRDGYLRNLYDADQQHQQKGSKQMLENASL
jgi:ABC-type multidrug transport system fused ATPase/permease subunit